MSCYRQLSKSGIRWQISHDTFASSDKRPVFFPLHVSRWNMTRLPTQKWNYDFTPAGLSISFQKFKVICANQTRSIESWQDGTSADQYDKTNNVGSDTRPVISPAFRSQFPTIRRREMSYLRLAVVFAVRLFEYTPSLWKAIDSCQTRASADYNFPSHWGHVFF